LPLDEVLEQLQKTFEDKGFQGQTNYEELLRYVQRARAKWIQMQKEDSRMEEQQQEQVQKRTNRRRQVEESQEQPTQNRATTLACISSYNETFMASFF